MESSRRARLFNPTYQSRNLYESMYRYQPYDLNKIPIAKIQNEPRSRSINQIKSERTSVEKMEQNPERIDQGYKLPAIKPNISNQNALNSSRTDESYPIGKRSRFQRFRIYENQQKPFNIISCQPKEEEINKLMSFPRLTLEDKLIERGSYHQFRQAL